MAHVFIGDLLTGRLLVPLPFASYNWSLRRNEPVTLSTKLVMTDPDVRALDLRNSATPGKTYLAIVEEVGGGEWFAGAGQMNDPIYDRDDGSLDLAAKGILSYLDRRNILPPTAASISVDDFLIDDPVEPTKTIPNPALATNLTGWSWGTIIKKWVQQALAWPGGGIPVVLPADVVGTHDSLVEGIEFKSVADAISEVVRLEGGPDVAFPARFQSDRLGIEWLLRTGTDAQPSIRSNTIHRWDLTATETTTRRLRVSYGTENMGALSWATGGRIADKALVARATSPVLTTAGFPLMEIVDGSHTDVVESDRLQEAATENLNRGQGASEVWTFEVLKDAPPYLGEYGVGDFCDLVVRDDPYIPDSPEGGYRREIAAMSGDEGRWVTVTTTEAVD